MAREHHELQTELERDASERRRRGVTFRELAHAYLRWIADVKDARPSTLRDYGWTLVEPGRPFLRGNGVSKGLVMAALGDRPAAEVTTREIEDMLRAVARSGVSARTVNKTRAVVCAIFNYGMRPSTYGLAVNPATHADRRRQPEPPPLAFYSPEEIEALARAVTAGAHRDVTKLTIGADEANARAAEDAQDAELVRIAAYAGLRRGELIALRWRDVAFVRRAITVRRAVSGDVEVESTKSRRAREVPLTDQVAAALDRLSRRGDFTSPDDYVFVNRFGRRIDPVALTRRFARARDAAGLPPLRFHGLRHTYGSLLVAGGIDLASVKAAMGHAQISTTERYLHARPATELAERFDRFDRGVGHRRYAGTGSGNRKVTCYSEAGNRPKRLSPWGARGHDRARVQQSGPHGGRRRGADDARRPRSGREPVRNRRGVLRERPCRRSRHGSATEISALMPRSLEQILTQADELADYFERHEPHRGEFRDAAALRAVRIAALRRARAEADVAEAVEHARADGHSWQSIGALLGTSGEAARQRYGQAARIH